MKHLLNNLSEGEKKDILAKYDGTLQVNTDKFIRLLESKLGDVKPYEYLNESREGNGKPYGYDKPTGKIYKTPKDPYQYQILKCKWHAKDGPKDKFLKDWTQVPEDGEKELNRRFPKAMIDAMCKEDSSREAGNLYDKTGLSDEKWKKLGMNCITQQLIRQVRTQDSTVQYFDKENDIVYFDNGVCYMNRQGNKYVTKGKSSCDDNMPNCTPV